MPTLNLKDPEVHRLAAELARRRGVSMTAAVRDALTTALASADLDRESRLARMADIGRRSAAIDAAFLTDDDLYDDRGLPR